MAEVDFSRAARLASQLPLGSRVGKKVHKENEWGWTEMLLNRIWHQLQVISWQQTEDAASRHPKNYPELWLPEFMESLKPKHEKELESHDLDDIKSILSRPRQSVTVKPNEQES